MISVWGTATRARVLDVTLRGNQVVRSGLVVRQPEGFSAARLVVRDFTDYGVLVDANDPARTELARPFRLADLDVAGVDAPGYRARPTAPPRRVSGSETRASWSACARDDCAWTGLWTGTATTDAVFDQIDVDQTPTGVYVEHFTRSSRFQRLQIGDDVRIGLHHRVGRPGNRAGVRPASTTSSRTAGSRAGSQASTSTRGRPERRSGAARS